MSRLCLRRNECKRAKRAARCAGKCPMSVRWFSALRINWFEPPAPRILPHEKNQARAENPPATVGNRPSLANGGFESPSGSGWQIVGALQTLEAQCRQNHQLGQRQNDRGKISEEEQGRLGSDGNCEFKGSLTRFPNIEGLDRREISGEFLVIIFGGENYLEQTRQLSRLQYPPTRVNPPDL